jgi:glycosyltransferase involved in cell wall biosynthesis
MALYHWLDTRLKRAALRRTELVLAPSDRIKAIYVSRGFTPSLLATVYNTAPALAPVTKPASPANTHHIVYAGKLSWGKGAPILVEALAAVAAALSPQSVCLTLAGQGPLRQYLGERAEQLGLADQLRFVGQLAHVELLQLLGQADLVVVPSVVQEAFGRVALESLLLGTPVVATNRGGLGEIVEDGLTGYLVEPEPAALAEAIGRALTHTELRTQVLARLPALREKFGEDIAQRHRQLYREILDRWPTKKESRGE